VHTSARYTDVRALEHGAFTQHQHKKCEISAVTSTLIGLRRIDRSQVPENAQYAGTASTSTNHTTRLAYTRLAHAHPHIRPYRSTDLHTLRPSPMYWCVRRTFNPIQPRLHHSASPPPSRLRIDYTCAVVTNVEGGARTVMH
jgi:hypothetical protein